MRRRSPPPRKSRTPEKPRSPSPSEWETDTEGESEAEEEEEAEKKEEPEVKAEEKKPVPEKKEVSNDDEGDDILKLDATAEEDEFSAFLNEFEDEVLAKKEEKKKPEKKEKKVRPPTEKKVVDGKKLRKKIKPKKDTPPPAERRSPSPRLTRSPGRRYFSPNRNKERFSPRRRDDRNSQDRLRANKSRERDIKSRERDNKSKEKVISKDLKPAESAAERAEREQREYEERIAKLPTPERERMEARRKKFDKKIDPNKKISLKSDKAEEEVNFDVRKRINRASADPDKGDDRRSRSPVRKNVTDLRVALHKKRKAQEGDNNAGQKVKKVDLNSKHPLMRATSLSPVDKGMDDLDDEDFGPVKSNRMVVPPKKSKNIRNSEDESDRSPSPPEKLVTKKRKSSGDVSDSLKNRRILVVRKGAGDSDQEEDFSITKRVSPNKGLK